MDNDEFIDLGDYKLPSPKNFEDLASDSVYPLMTNDPSLKKDFTFKNHCINNQKLEQVFDEKNDQNFNLNSVYINYDYIKSSK